MGKSFDNISNFLIVGGAVALVWCGIGIAKPNLHGTKFVEGNCTITSATTTADWDELPSCNCGKNCHEEYPCVTVYASFESSVSGTSFDMGTLHKDYQALSSDCLVVPDCSSDYSNNAASVYIYFVAKIVPRVDYDYRYPYLLGWNETVVNYTDMSSFECWGYDHDMYFDHSYSAMIAYISLGIPAGCLVLGLFLSCTAGSDGQRELVVGLITFPFVMIGEIFGCNCKRKCRSCVSGFRSCLRPRIRTVYIERDASESPIPQLMSLSDLPRERFARRLQEEVSMSITVRTRSASDTSIQTPEYITSADRRSSLNSLERGALQSFEYPSYSFPSSYTAPVPSYTTTPTLLPATPTYLTPPFNPTPIITVPPVVSPYTSAMDLPPPSYNDVIASDAPTATDQYDYIGYRTH